MLFRHRDSLLFPHAVQRCELSKFESTCSYINQQTPDTFFIQKIAPSQRSSDSYCTVCKPTHRFKYCNPPKWEVHISVEENSHATREMPIASSDFDDFGETGSRRNSVHVVPPRKGAPQQLQQYNEWGLSANEEALRSEMKAAKAELSMTKAEVEQRSMDLAESEAQLRAKASEVTLLRAAMVGRDIGLRNAKAEAAEAQNALKDKDEELQGAFQQLLSNAKERGDLRTQLLSIQEELKEARKELEDWAQQGFKLMQAAEKLSSSEDESEDEEIEVRESPRTSRGVAGTKPSVDPAQMTKLLENLQRLSQSIADDALADEEAISRIVR